MKIRFRSIATALTVAMSIILLSVSLHGLVGRHQTLLPGAVMDLPLTSVKGVALLMLDGSRDAQRTLYIDALLAQSYAVLQLPVTVFPSDPATLDAVADQLAARAGVAVHAPLLVAIGADSSRRAASLLEHDGAAHALVSVDFCPPIGSSTVAASTAPRPPWYALQHRDAGCPPGAVERALSAVPNTHLTWLATSQKSDAAPAVEFGALLQWLDPSIVGQGQASATLRGIPLIELPVVHARRMVVFFSGDGGWAAFDRGVAAALNGAGIAVLGWDSLSYFWQPRPPAVLARDLARVITVFGARWHVQSVVVAGFSFGASSVPFAVNGLPASVRARIEKVVMLGPTPTTSFEFRLSQWLGSDKGDTVAVAPEIAKLAPVPVWCVRGEDDSEAACPPLAPPSRAVALPGDHHFNGDYAELARLIATPPLRF